MENFLSMGMAISAVRQTFKDRLRYARANTGEILQKVWVYVIIAIGIGGFIHGYAPDEFLAGNSNPSPYCLLSRGYLFNAIFWKLTKNVNSCH